MTLVGVPWEGVSAENTAPETPSDESSQNDDCPGASTTEIGPETAENVCIHLSVFVH